MTELDLLKELHSRLEKLDLPYMVTGSMALAYYAQPRMTRDIDVVIEIIDKDTSKIYNEFKDEYYISEEAITDAINQRSMFNAIHNASGLKIDFIVRKQSDYRELEFERRQIVLIDNSKIYIVSLEDLILSKLSWGKDSQSEMQMRDVKSLLGQPHDVHYLNQWALKLGLKSFLEKCRI